MLAVPACPLLVRFTPAPGLELVVEWNGAPVAEVLLPGADKPLERWQMYDSRGEPLVPCTEIGLGDAAAYRVVRAAGLDRLIAVTCDSISADQMASE